MNRMTNLACMLIAAASLSFAVGQAVGQDRAQAEPQAAKVLKVRDAAAKSYLQLIFRMQVLMNDNLKDIKEQSTTSTFNLPGAGNIKTTRGLLRQICENTNPSQFGSGC